MVILTRQGVRRFSSELLLAIELRIDSIRGGRRYGRRGVLR